MHLQMFQGQMFEGPEQKMTAVDSKIIKKTSEECFFMSYLFPFYNLESLSVAKGCPDDNVKIRLKGKFNLYYLYIKNSQENT